jgi:hypothetical protein
MHGLQWDYSFSRSPHEEELSLMNRKYLTWKREEKDKFSGFYLITVPLNNCFLHPTVSLHIVIREGTFMAQIGKNKTYPPQNMVGIF